MLVEVQVQPERVIARSLILSLASLKMLVSQCVYWRLDFKFRALTGNPTSIMFLCLGAIVI